MPSCTLQYNFIQLRKRYFNLQLKFVLSMIKRHEIVNCENTESVTSHDLHPPPSPVTNCHTFSDPLGA